MNKNLSPLEAQVMAHRAYALLKDFQQAIENSMEGDHPAAEEVMNWLARYESAAR